MEHTKLPWEMTKIPFELRNTDDVACIYGQATPNGSPLIACISRSPGDKEAEANADLIFKAVMNHDSLVDALEKMVKLVSDIDNTLFHHNHNIEGWHLNGELEPIMNFVANYDMEALQIAQETLNKLKQ